MGKVEVKFHFDINTPHVKEKVYLIILRSKVVLNTINLKKVNS